jgi:hypothetical protein
LNVVFSQALNFKAVFKLAKVCDNAGDSVSHYLLALATLGDVTQIGLFLFLVMLPKVAKTSTVTLPKVTVACRFRQQFR